MTLWEQLLRDRALLDREYDTDDWNPRSGLPLKELEESCRALLSETAGEPRSRVKPRLIELSLDRAQVGVHPASLFADKLNHGNLMESIRWGWQREAEAGPLAPAVERNRALAEARACTGDPDFGHTCPGWDEVLSLGLTGLLERLETLRAEKPDRAEFYDGSIRVYRAALRALGRLRAEAERKASGSPLLCLTADALRALETGAPRTFCQALQLMIVYYMLQHHLDSVVVRSMGGLDALLWPFYRNDVEAGRLTPEDARAMLGYFFLKLRAKHFGANIPFYLCGVNRDGESCANPLSAIILEVYGALDIQDPKIHIRCGPETDPELLRLALRLIREGKNSILFINGPVVSGALERLGETPEDARDFAIVGCYEPMAVNREVPCTCNGRINLVKAVELALSDGVDLLTGERLLPASGLLPESWEDFLARLAAVLEELFDRCAAEINAYEERYMELCPSPFFSATLPCSREQGVDVYAGGAVYNNSSTNILGVASAACAGSALRNAVSPFRSCAGSSGATGRGRRSCGGSARRSARNTAAAGPGTTGRRNG